MARERRGLGIDALKLCEELLEPNNFFARVGGADVLSLVRRLCGLVGGVEGVEGGLLGRVGLLGDALLAGRERDHTFAKAKEGSFGGAGCGWAVCPGRVGKSVDAEELHVAVLAVDEVGRRVGVEVAQHVLHTRDVFGARCR